MAVLKTLVERQGETVTRAELIDRCWGPDELPTKRTIDNFILRLRRRFEPDTRYPRHLVTVFGKGYRFVRVAPNGPEPELGYTVYLCRRTRTGLQLAQVEMDGDGNITTHR